MRLLLSALQRRAFFVILINLFAAQAFSNQCIDLFKTQEIFTEDGFKFQYSDIISSSGQSIIYRLDNNHILRMFKSSNAEQSTQRFVDGYQLLKNNGLKDIADIARYGKNWVIQKYVNVAMTLEYFIFHMEELKLKKPEEFKKMFNEFLIFSIQTKTLEDIGDFHSGQLVWNGRKWVLLDWNHESELAHPQSKITFILGLEVPSVLAKQLLDQATSSILHHRNGN